jgi:hypothetical protein
MGHLRRVFMLLLLAAAASGAGIFLLLVADARTVPAEYLFAAGLFGCVVTLGLYFHELYSIRWCDALFACGIRIEERLWLAATEQGLPDPELGPFRTAPAEFAGYVSARGAALIIYPATMSAWSYLAIARTKLAGPGSLWAWMIPALVLATFALIGWATIRPADTAKQSSDALGRDCRDVA